jgi:hypothetical protein
MPPAAAAAAETRRFVERLDRHNRQARLDAVDRYANGVADGHAGLMPDEQLDMRPRLLREGHVNVRASAVSDHAILRVLHDADHLDRHARLVPGQNLQEPLTDRGTVRPCQPRERFIHDGDVRPPVPIAGVEPASSHNRQTDRPEVVG